MTPRPILAVPLLLSMSGCVAVPLITQAAANPEVAKQFCSFAKMPGQTASLCDRTPADGIKQAAGKPVTTVASTTPAIR